jgi:hypothetical protein
MYVALGGFFSYSSLLDKNGKVVWKENIEGDSVLFSPDGNSLILDITFHLIDVQNKKRILNLPSMKVSSISENAEFICLEGRKEEEGLYNKEGKLILKGKITISGNGKVIVKDSGGRIEIFRFPDMIKISAYPIKRNEGKSILMSYDGRIVVIFGKRTDKDSAANLFVIDTVAKTLWEGLIANLKETILYFITRDGRYLTVINGKWSETETPIYYYQLF